MDRASYGPAGARFFAAYEKRYHDPDPEVYAIYAYEAMSLMLDAIRRSGTGERQDVVNALLDTEDRESVLGTYSINVDGDTTLTDYGVFRITDGRSDFVEKIHVQAL